MPINRCFICEKILLSAVIILLMASCDTNPTSKNKTGVLERNELFSAITIGLPLGILAAKYIPELPEDSRDAQRRSFYTPLLQSSVDGLKITLIPPPKSLLKSGRGQRQYDKVMSYFGQIGRNSKKYPQCIRYTVGLSLNSAWLLLMYHEARYVINIQEFKQRFLWRFDQFNGLIAAASMACEEEYGDFSDKLSFVSKQSTLWQIQLNKSKDENDIVATVESIGKNIADSLNDLAEVASGLSLSSKKSE